jgi:hypothetical protein
MQCAVVVMGSLPFLRGSDRSPTSPADRHRPMTVFQRQRLDDGGDSQHDRGWIGLPIVSHDGSPIGHGAGSRHLRACSASFQRPVCIVCRAEDGVNPDLLIICWKVKKLIASGRNRSSSGACSPRSEKWSRTLRANRVGAWAVLYEGWTRWAERSARPPLDAYDIASPLVVQWFARGQASDGRLKGWRDGG